MCGISGFLGELTDQNQGSEILKGMIGSLVHRGPDGSGVWMDPDAHVGIGHRRLSIQDLSAAGHQPMLSESGRYVIAFNGEIYNFRELRRELDHTPHPIPLLQGERGHKWRGHSDTEVMLAAIETWGLEAAVKRFVGMFAFALWDRRERRLHLVRDRLGIKPLYYGWVGGCFLFGSELKALKAFPGFDRPIDRGALALLMRHNYVPAPHSIYQGIYKLLPGHVLTVAGDGRKRSPEISAWWSAREVAETGVANPFSGSMEEAVERLDGLLREAVGIRMVADVPLGAFLSGGYDSSTVVALMQAQSARPVKTFSIGFHEEGYNEARHAKAVAAHLGTEHTELYVTPEEAMAVIPRLPTLYDEPFADSSQIPTFLVSQLAREHVTVSLSGDGGDELFAGYNRYAWGQRIWGNIGWLPAGMRSMLARLMTSASPKAWDRVFKRLVPVLPHSARVRLPGYKVHKLAEILAVEGPDALYRRLVSHWKEPSALVLDGEEPLTALTDPSRQARLADFTQRMMFTDLISYLPDDILTKVDRASMGVSLEARVPLLDHRVVEFAWRLPRHMKVRSGEGKWILRQVLYKYVPRELMDRPKMGFGVPIDQWLRGPLRDWAESVLSELRLCEEGFFDLAPIREKWEEHLSGKRNWQYYLWDVLMFQSWFEHTKRDTKAARLSAKAIL